MQPAAPVFTRIECFAGARKKGKKNENRKILSFRPEPDPERSRRGRRSGGTCCFSPAPELSTIFTCAAPL